MNCPKAQQEHCNKELSSLLEGSSWVCYKAECNKGKDEEFYRSPNGKLLTREEFFMQKEEFNG